MTRAKQDSVVFLLTLFLLSIPAIYSALTATPVSHCETASCNANEEAGYE